MAHILIIEDDPHLGPRLQRTLDLSGFRTTLASDGRRGWDEVRAGQADLIVLDLMLPKMDGLDILKEMRKIRIHTPVIILTAKGNEWERLDGFQAGCDDYVTKPFSLPELIARIRAVLKRSGYIESMMVANSAGVMVDPEARQCEMRGEAVQLAPKEFDLLYLLVSQPDKVLSREYLINEVWGLREDITDRTVDTHVSHLRKRLDQQGITEASIETVYKVGYKWSAKAKAESL